MFNKVVLAADHRGYEYKNNLITKVSEILPSVEIIDCGTNSSEPCDYPLLAYKCASHVKSSNVFAVVICASGVGMSIAMNRFSHIRCAIVRSAEEAKLARAHNNINSIAIGSSYHSVDEVALILKESLISNFDGGRHQKRVDYLSSKGSNA